MPWSLTDDQLAFIGFIVLALAVVTVVRYLRSEDSNRNDDDADGDSQKYSF